MKDRKAILSATSHADRDIEDDLDLHGPNSINCGVYFALVLFSIGGTIVTNTLWVELPVLTKSLPDGQHLSLIMLGLLQLGNLSPSVFLLLRRCSRNGLNEAPSIYIGLMLSTTCIGLLAFFWDYVIEIFDQSYSVVVLLTCLVATQMTCLATVTYIPFVARLKSVYITSVLLGEVIAALIPHIVGVAEGLGSPTECIPDIQYSPNKTRVYISNALRPGRRRPTTTPAPVIPPKLRFEEMYFFLATLGAMGLSLFVFMLIRNIPSVRFEYEEIHVDCMDDVELNGRGQAIEDDPDELWQTQTDGGYVLDDGTVRHPTLHHDGLKKTEKKAATTRGHGTPTKVTPTKSTPTKVTFRGPPVVKQKNSTSIRSRITSGSAVARLTSSTSADSGDHSKFEGKVPSFVLLMLITFWSSAVIYGPLSSVKAHACLPSGNNAFLIGTILTNFVTAIICIVICNMKDKLKTTLVVAFTSLGTILLTYFVALIAFSHESENREQSPIFGSMGEILATIAWTAILGLFFFAKTTIAVFCRAGGRDCMYWYAGMVQLGAAVGSLCMIDNISICRVYKEYQVGVCSN